MSKSRKISVRAHTSAYLSAAAAAAFLSAYSLYIGYDLVALIAIAIALTSFPVLALTDRIVFDGKRLRRTGPFWQLYMMATGRRRRAKPRAVVHVETEAVRALRRGARVTYLYRTSFYTADHAFCIGSGRGFREMIMTVLPLVSEGSLDIRSAELRDHLKQAWEVSARARELQIPSSDVLDARAMLSKYGRGSASLVELPEPEQVERSEQLRSVANQLRTNGRLIQSLEAFRRALRLTPRNGRLIYEFARCLQSLAAANRDPMLDRKAQAMLRLAERRSAGDSELMSRLGETYFSVGAWRRAENIFRKAADTGTAGYRIFRGLGELALRDGKIAHAIHHFSRSAEHAKPAALFHWARAEADYLRHLNDDEEYMELEIGRINLFDTFEGARRTTLKIFGFGLALVISGLLMSAELLANIGWAVSGVSLLIWLGATILKHSFAARIPFELLDKD